MEQDAKMYKTLLRSFKDSVGFVNHQVTSFNEFVDFRIQRIIDEIGEIELETPELAEFKIKLGKVRVPKPNVKEADGAVRKITPMEARIRDLTYASPIFVEMIPIINGVEQEPQEVKLGDLPIMVKSKLIMPSLSGSVVKTPTSKADNARRASPSLTWLKNSRASFWALTLILPKPFSLS